MKASEFIVKCEAHHGITLALHRGRLHILGTLPRRAHLAIAAQRDSLVTFLAHVEDRDLRVPPHPEGDEVAEQMFLGLIERDEDRDARRHREAVAFGAARVVAPPVEPITLKPGQHPGHFTFTLEKGRRYRS